MKQIFFVNLVLFATILHASSNARRGDQNKQVENNLGSGIEDLGSRKPWDPV